MKDPDLAGLPAVFFFILFVLAGAFWWLAVVMQDDQPQNYPIPPSIHEQRTPQEDRLDKLEKRIAELEKTLARRY